MGRNRIAKRWRHELSRFVRRLGPDGIVVENRSEGRGHAIASCVSGALSMTNKSHCIMCKWRIVYDKQKPLHHV